MHPKGKDGGQTALIAVYDDTHDVSLASELGVR